MIVHNFDPVLIDFGLFQIRWYSISYILGIILGWVYAIQIIKKIKKNPANYNSISLKDFDDLIIYLILGIIIGGRFGYVFLYDFSYYSQNLSEIFKLWQGGMSFHGGLLGVAIAILIFSVKKKKKFYPFADIISCVAPIGIFLGRIANFINGELYGKISNLPWAIVFPGGGAFPRHPSQLYEAVLEGIILFILINFLAFKKNFIFKTGYISGIFLISYSLLRIFSETFREPDKQLGYFLNYFSMGTILSIVMLIMGFLIIFSIKKNEQNN